MTNKKGRQPANPTPRVEDERVEAEKIVVPLVDEHLEVRKQWVQSGEVVVRKTVQTSQQTIPVELLYEEVQVDRVPVNRPLADGEQTQPWWDGEVMVVPVIEEEIVVSKRLVLREEVRISKRKSVRHETVSDSIRNQQVYIDTTGSLRPRDDPSPRNNP
ncbi:MAG: hypothetical protein QOH93_3067 [Chloroflexia bacterium]|jgi:uncharacterized protein (TIGR02271 family)|nr:hypothetical protein [Chloroflexia bacterium]